MDHCDSLLGGSGQPGTIVAYWTSAVKCLVKDTDDQLSGAGRGGTLVAVSNGFEEPTVAYQQAMNGDERVRPRATPAGAFERAREYLRAGKRIDMVALAADLGVARATLYRWTGDRERLLADATWAEAHAVADHMLHRSRRKTGLARIQSVCVDFLDAFAGNEGVATFLEHERDAGLELLTRVNGGFRPRLVAWIADMIQAEIDAGRYRAPAHSTLLADGIITIGERFLHHGGDPDVTPDAASAGRMIAVLLREA
jgi:AcrR family transcriptional regulator